MGLKNWVDKRREKKEKQERFEELTEEENQELYSTEKKAYLGIAKKQVSYRGKINAYKDYPINDVDKQEIDMEKKFVEEQDIKNEEDNNEELTEIEKELELDDLNESEEKQHDAGEII